MKLGKAITAGFGRATRSFKPILIIWFFSVIGISILALPLKSIVLSDMGNSMGTEMIKEVFSIDFWAGLDVTLPVFGGLIKGVLYLVFIYLFINVFLNGGLFDALKANICGYPVKGFFKASVSNFFSFLSVTLLVILMIIFASGLVVVIPALIVRAGNGGEPALMNTLKIARIVLLLVLPIFLLVVDYSRSWLAASNQKLIFKSLGYGFKATFSSFLSSYLFMIIVMTVQAGFIFLVSKAMDFRPETNGGLFVLFLLSQVLFVIKLFLRAWRYGGVTTMFTI